MRDVLKRIGSIIRRAGANSELAVDTGFGGANDRLIEVVAHSHRAGVAAADLQALASAYALTVRRPPADTDEAGAAANTGAAAEPDAAADPGEAADPGDADAAAAGSSSVEALLHSDATIAAVDEILSDTPDISVILTGLPSLQIADLVKVEGPVGEAARRDVDAARRAARARPGRSPEARARRLSRSGRLPRPRTPAKNTRTYRSWSRLVVGVHADLRHKRSGERRTVEVVELLGPTLGKKRGLIDQHGGEYREAEYDVSFELPGAGDES